VCECTEKKERLHTLLNTFENGSYIILELGATNAVRSPFLDEPAIQKPCTLETLREEMVHRAFAGTVPRICGVQKDPFQQSSKEQRTTR
jgi:hypothetical protein